MLDLATYFRYILICTIMRKFVTEPRHSVYYLTEISNSIDDLAVLFVFQFCIQFPLCLQQLVVLLERPQGSVITTYGAICKTIT